MWRCAIRKASLLPAHASPRLFLKGHTPHVSRWLARQLSYAFEQSAQQIKMKDFATYTTLIREAMEFDEVHTRLQTQLVIQAPRAHTDTCNQMPSCAMATYRSCGSVSLPPQAACDLISVRMYNDDSKQEAFIKAALSSKVREFSCIQSVLFSGPFRSQHANSCLRST